uniref:Uncharacterized protein n=1 Tax=Megaselia scalaris TaxID=36166 RepID=T1GPX6_MEGSC
MAKLEQTSYSDNGSQVYLQLGSLLVLLSMVVTVLGIKFKWFKHNCLLSQFQPQKLRFAQGVFRWRSEDDIAVERPASLPPVRIRKISPGPPPPLILQKRTVIAKPPGQELIPETPQVEPQTPPTFIPRSKRDKSPQKSPLCEVTEEKLGTDYDEVLVNRRPQSEFLGEPEVPKRTKKLRPKSMEVSLVSNESPNQEEIPVHKPIRQKKISPKAENGFNFDIVNNNLFEEDKSAHLEVQKDSETEKSVHFEIEEESKKEPTFERRDTGFSKPEIVHCDTEEKSVHFEDQENNNHYEDYEHDSKAQNNFEKLFFEHLNPLKNQYILKLKKIQKRNIPLREEIQRSVHFEIPEYENVVQEKRTDYENVVQEKTSEYENVQKSVHFEIDDEEDKKEHTFERRDTGFTRPQIEELIPEDSEKRLSKEDLEKSIVIVEEEDEILEKKELVPSILLFEAEELGNETEIDSLPAQAAPTPPVVPAPRRSKESAVCITFEESEPQLIAFADDGVSQESVDIDVEKIEKDENLNKKPVIVDVKERPSFLGIQEPVRPIPRQRSVTGQAPQPPPLPKTPPPVLPDNSNDNWTAIQIHRNLTKELNAEILTVALKKSAEREARANLEVKNVTNNSVEEVEPPKNMRDMMRRRREEFNLVDFNFI